MDRVTKAERLSDKEAERHTDAPTLIAVGSVPPGFASTRAEACGRVARLQKPATSASLGATGAIVVVLADC